MAPQEIWPFLNRLGFEAKAVSTNIEFGFIRLAGKEVAVSFGQASKRPYPNGGMYVNKLSLNFDFWPVKWLSPNYARHWEEDHFREIGCPRMRVGLNGRVSLRQYFSLDDGGTEERLYTELKGFESAMKGLFEDVAPVSVPPKFILDEKQRVDILDSEDVNELLEIWGWVYHGTWGSSGGWKLPAYIEKTLITIGGLDRGRIFLRLSTKVPERKGEAEFRAELEKVLTGISVRNSSPGELSLYLELDLRGGLSLGEIKSRILRFSKAVAPYAIDRWP